MNGIHDMGGMRGFGPVEVEPNEPAFHGRWEKRVRGMVYQVVGFGWTTIDAFRHGIERMPAADYLAASYYGKWLTSLETVLVDAGVLGPHELDARVEGRSVAAGVLPPGLPRPAGGFERVVDRAPRFAVGETVRARNLNPRGHTRLPRYVRGRRGVVDRVHAAFVFPDTNAHGQGERPQHVYGIRFDVAELWGPGAEGRTAVHVDLFEEYLEPA